MSIAFCFALVSVTIGEGSSVGTLPACEDQDDDSKRPCLPSALPEVGHMKAMAENMEALKQAKIAATKAELRER